MKRAAVSCLMVAFFAGYVFSQTVNICGMVTDPGGKPLTNTLVRLGQTRFTDAYGNEPYYTTTDSNGQYHLGTGTCAVNTIIPGTNMRGDAFSQPRYVGGKVLFSVPQDNASVKMNIYDLAGRFVENVLNCTKSTGNYSASIDTRGISSQFYMLRVTINGASTVMRLQPATRSAGGSIVQNTPEFQTRMEKLAAVVDTLHATEPGYTLGVTPIQALAGQFDFTLTKNNTWNGDTDTFWDTANVMKQAGHIWYTVLNRTNGVWADSQIYWAIGDGGAAVRLSDSAHIDFTTSGSGRLYIMVGYNPAAGNLRPSNQVWDFEEHTNGMLNGSLWFHGNTTRVDAFGTPMMYRLHCTDGFDTVRGDQYSVYYQTRQSYFDEFENEVPYEFSKLGTMQAPYKIPNPGTNGSDVGPGGKYATYSDKYCAAFGVGETPYLNGIASPCISAACYRHVMISGGCDNNADIPIQMQDDSYFYKAAPCCFYSYFLHRRSIDNKCYGFPYDDWENWSSYIEHGNVSWLELAVGY